MMRSWVARGAERTDVAVEDAGDRLRVVVGAEEYEVELAPVGANLSALLLADGRCFSVAHRRLAAGHYRISLGDREFEVRLRDPLEREMTRAAGAGGPQDVRAPIPGKVTRVLVAPGDEVRQGQPLLVLEAMKMENQICAEGPGQIGQILVGAGATVDGGQVLVSLL